MKDAEIIPKDRFRSTAWSGGTTDELVIMPEGSSYAERRFGFRISSASVDLESSVFTPLPGVKRFLTPLCSGFTLTVNGREADLPHGSVIEFSGDDSVLCRGSGRDLNLMLKNADGQMKYVCGGFSVRECEFAYIYTENGCILAHNGEEETLPAGAFARIGMGGWSVSAPTVLFLIFRVGSAS